MATWEFDEAEEYLEILIELAATKRPQIIIRGEDRFVVVSAAEWDALTRPKGKSRPKD
jgi:hypothetical protein